MEKTVNSWSELQKAIQEKIDETLQDEVANTVKKQISESASNIVYKAYEPTIYWRRKYTDRGLADEEIMNSNLVSSGELVVTNDAPFNPKNIDGTHEPEGEEPEHEKGITNMNKSLAYNIEYGWGSRSESYSKPRPFMSNAKEHLRNGKAREALKKGLRKRGLDAQ